MTILNDCFSLLKVVFGINCLNSNAFSQNKPKGSFSVLGFIILCLIITILVTIICLLMDSNLVSSLTNKLTTSNLNVFSKKVLNKLNSFWQHSENILSTKQDIASSALFYGVNDSIAVTNLQQIMSTIDTLNKQVEQRKNDPSYQNRLGLLYAQIGEFKAAIEYLNRAVSLSREQLCNLTKNQNSKLNNQNANSANNLSFAEKSAIFVQLSCAHSALARIYDKLGDQQQVMSELDQLNNEVIFAGDIPKVIVIGKNNSTKISATASNKKNKKLTPTEAAILARAEALRQVGRLAQAVQEYRKLIALDPDLAIAHQRLGLAAVSDNNLWLAINELQTAAQLDSGDADTQNDLGLIYKKIGDYKLAKQCLGNAYKIQPKHLNAAVNFANILADEGDYKKGMAIMRRAIIDYPKSSIAHNNLASLIARTGKQTEAVKEFSKAINLEPTLASAHYGLGIALLKLKSYPAAIKEFQTAMTLNPGILDLQNKIDLANRYNLRSLASTQQEY